MIRQTSCKFPKRGSISPASRAGERDMDNSLSNRSNHSLASIGRRLTQEAAERLSTSMLFSTPSIHRKDKIFSKMKGLSEEFSSSALLEGPRAESKPDLQRRQDNDPLERTKIATQPQQDGSTTKCTCSMSFSLYDYFAHKTNASTKSSSSESSQQLAALIPPESEPSSGSFSASSIDASCADNLMPHGSSSPGAYYHEESEQQRHRSSDCHAVWIERGASRHLELVIPKAVPPAAAQRQTRRRH